MSINYPPSPRGSLNRRSLKLAVDRGALDEGGGSNGHWFSSSVSPDSPSSASAFSPTESSDETLRYRHIRQRTDSSTSPFSYSNSYSDEGSQLESQSHPLEGAKEDNDWAQFEGIEVLGDVSRPALARYTSETERQAAESSRGSEAGSGSHRGSLDLLRMSQARQEDAGEVEVLVHQVQPNQSLPGIALLYGIDLAILRKVNKLWPSDPVHLRTHLYVPVEACKWNKASLIFRRGPGEGQVTLLAKGQPQQNGASRKGKEVDRGNGLSPVEHYSSTQLARPERSLIDFEPDVSDGLNDYAEWSEAHPQTFSPQQHLSETSRSSMDTLHPTSTSPEPQLAHTVDIVRMPASQLRFFPKVRKPPDRTPRSSLDQDLRRTSLTQQRQTRMVEDGPSIQNDLMTLPRPLRPDSPPKPKAPKSNIVRLRPPTAAPAQPTNSLADKLSQLFVVPPPPSQPAWGSIPPPSRAKPRRSMDSAGSANPPKAATPPRSKPVSRPEVLLEMTPRSSPDPPRSATHSRRDSKKLD